MRAITICYLTSIWASICVIYEVVFLYLNVMLSQWGMVCLHGFCLLLQLMVISFMGTCVIKHHKTNKEC